MKISLLTALRYAWDNRAKIASHEGYAAYLRRIAARPDAAYWAKNSAGAGAYPDGPDGGWRYDFTRLPAHDQLLDTYKLNAVAGQGDTLKRALRVMDWLTAHTLYNGMEVRACYLFQGKREETPRILRYARDGGFLRAVNCRHKAIALADCLLAVGVAAMPLGLWSYTYRPGEEIVTPMPNHYVVQLWLPEERRWVMFDPSFNAYVTDATERALHLAEIQAAHRAGETLRAAKYDFNGTQDCRETYLDGFILGSLLEITACDGSRRMDDFRNHLLPEDVPQKEKRMITLTELLAEPKNI